MLRSRVYDVDAVSLATQRVLRAIKDPCADGIEALDPGKIEDEPSRRAEIACQFRKEPLEFDGAIGRPATR